MAKNSTTDEFFCEQTQKSQIKSSIVCNFFGIYLPIIFNRFRQNDIYYIDLFSGPGSYDDGTKSTPLYILDQVEKFGEKKAEIFNRIHFHFNEKETGNYKLLIDKVKNHQIYSKLKYTPLVTIQNADDVDLGYIKDYSPIFSFVDPFGYISTSAQQIWDLVSNIGSDCIFFFNANRIILDINKRDREQYFERLFGDGLFDLRTVLEAETSHRMKMEKVLQSFSDNLFKSYKNPRYQLFILPFGFEFDDRAKLSHYLLFITKNHKAVMEMKNVMNKLATSISETYCYDSKAVYQISLFDEEAEMVNSILSTVKQFGNELKNPPYGGWDVAYLLEYVDILKMRRDKRVTPFSLRNFKAAIKGAYDKGYINESLNFRKTEIFAESKKFTFKNDFWEVT